MSVCIIGGMAQRKQINFRLTDKGRTLLAALSDKLGVNQTAVVEMAIRRMAEEEKVVDSSDQEPTKQ